MTNSQTTRIKFRWELIQRKVEKKGTKLAAFVENIWNFWKERRKNLLIEEMAVKEYCYEMLWNKTLSQWSKAENKTIFSIVVHYLLQNL